MNIWTLAPAVVAEEVFDLDSPSRLDCALRSGSQVELFMLEACDQFREGLCILTFVLLIANFCLTLGLWSVE